jgi:SAM-dependent methyltransferase
LLHPIVRAKLYPSACIADVGTGTAAFLRSLARDWPKATLHGYDISTGLFPPVNTLPSNVTLFLYDARQDVPSYLREKYDLVHVRLIAAGLSAREWTGAVKNLFQLLKPGGVIQWEECDFTAVRHLPGDPDSTIDTASVMGRMFLTAMRPRFEYGWNEMAADMRAAGLENVQTEAVAAHRLYATRARLTANGMEAIFAWARLQSARGSEGALSMDQLGQLEQKAYADIQSGCYVTFDVHVAWGFRSE